MLDSKLPSGVGWTAVAALAHRAKGSEHSAPLYEDAPASALMRTLQRQLDDLIPQVMHLAGGPEYGDYIPLRTRFVDDRIQAAVHAGARQVVILGAGLDTRAYRDLLPPFVRVFEVDTREVVDFKRGLVADAGLVPVAKVISIAADLAGDWPAALGAADFDAGQTTAWVLEGVLNYLTGEQRINIVKELLSRSSADSRLVSVYVQHVDRGVFATEDPEVAKVRAMVSAESFQRPEAWLPKLGWTPEQVTTMVELAATHDRQVPPSTDQRAGQATCWLVDSRRS